MSRQFSLPLNFVLATRVGQKAKLRITIVFCGSEV